MLRTIKNFLFPGEQSAVMHFRHWTLYRQYPAVRRLNESLIQHHTVGSAGEACHYWYFRVGSFVLLRSL